MIVNNYKCLNYATTAAFASILLLFVSPLNAKSQLRSIQNPDSEPSSHHRDLKEDHAFGSRIVGGDNAGEGEFKFMVNWDESCGGSLIHDQLVLTAAHCGGMNGGVRIGSHLMYSGGVTRQVAQKVGHPSYNDQTTAYDYMILKLDQAVDISAFPPIELNSNVGVPNTGEMLTVIGFGVTSEGGSQSTRLQKVEVPTNSNQQCENQYPGEIDERIHLCAGFQEGGKDSCQGDSGGPIFTTQSGKPVLVGVVSFGEGCARPNRSGVYARVSGEYDWIQSQICELATVNRPRSCGTSSPTPQLAPTVPGPTALAPAVSWPPQAGPTVSAPTAPAPTVYGPTQAGPTVSGPTGFDDDIYDEIYLLLDLIASYLSLAHKM